MSSRFQHKIAIVTGGSSGIGDAIARRIAAEGGQVIVADIADPPRTGDGIWFERCDVTCSDAVAALIESARLRFGRLDVLVNNAGVGYLAETPDLSFEAWEKVMAINVNAVFYACRAAIPLMREGAGDRAILNVASISGVAGDYGFSAYNASKGAVINYSRSMALDCARDGIRVNVLCPGAIARTALGIGTHGSDADKAEWLDRIPLGRLGNPEEMANVASFLASEEASYITGAVIVADGGTTAHTGQPNIPAQLRRRPAASVGPAGGS